MLNEQREYQLLFTENFDCVLRKENIRRDLSGIRQVLTTLARGFLELAKNEGIEDIADKTSLCCDFLKCWIIGEYSLDKPYPKKIVEEFKRAQKYSLYNNIVINQITIKKIKSSEETEVYKYLKSKVKDWSNELFSSSQKSSVNSIYFKGIIADALFMGPLKNMVLTLKNTSQNFGITCNNEAKEYLKELLAVVAICLKSVPKGQENSIAKLAVISNYLNKPTTPKNSRSKIYKSLVCFFDENEFSYNKEPIIVKKELTSGVIKFAFNKAWLKDYDVKLINANEKPKTGYISFTDDDLLNK